MRPGGVRDDDGFSLIELMVVVLIIAVLLGIALPSFLGARDRSSDRAVTANVRSAFAAVRVYYADDRRYTADTEAMRSIEPALQWTNTPLDGTGSSGAVYIEVQDFPSEAQTVVVVGRSKTGRCFYIRDVMAGSTTGTHYQAQVPDGATCSVPPLNDPAWGDSWTD